MTAEELRVLLSYAPETGLFTWLLPTGNRAKKGRIAGKISGAGYVYIGLRGKSFLAHRLAWLYVHGSWPVAQIDHINRIRVDNRLCNLRSISASGNMQNLPNRKDNTSGMRGVVWRKDISKWQAQIRVGGQHFGLGVFSLAEDAEAAYIAAVAAYHPYATQNKKAPVVAGA